jgi:hypothetical protein
MKVLVIDSHKSVRNTPAQNLHWINARKIADHFGGDLIWSYKGVNDEIKGGYDKIIFVHASHYAYTDYAWLEASPDADLYYITNEYNLGEPRTLWMAAKTGRKYTVIANHDPKPSKVVMKYVDMWEVCNLNALCYEGKKEDPFSVRQDKAVYYGSFRKGRGEYFKKYLSSPAVLTSTHSKNHEKFEALGLSPHFIPRLNWGEVGLSSFKYSLYMEDEVTHTHYNYLANRFYEALMWGCVTLFDESCRGTLEKCGYPETEDFVISSPDEILECTKDIPEVWHKIAEGERVEALNFIEQVVSR